MPETIDPAHPRARSGLHSDSWATGTARSVLPHLRPCGRSDSRDRVRLLPRLVATPRIPRFFGLARFPVRSPTPFRLTSAREPRSIGGGRNRSRCVSSGPAGNGAMSAPAAGCTLRGPSLPHAAPYSAGEGTSRGLNGRREGDELARRSGASLPGSLPALPGVSCRPARPPHWVRASGAFGRRGRYVVVREEP